MDCIIDTLKASDWEEVRTIHLAGIATQNATFETEPPTWEKWDFLHMPILRFVARSGDGLLGWAALSRVSGRPCYAGVAEVSVYVAARCQAQGIGSALLHVLVEASEANGIWTLQAGIFPENAASLALVKKFGFREVGRRERIGNRNGVWRDVLLLERRSKVVGT
jgi:L-amino acid N-acyltransferase YncA